MKKKAIVLDCATGKQEVQDIEFVPPEPAPPYEKPINQAKLKAMLKAKGIIMENSEVE